MKRTREEKRTGWAVFTNFFGKARLVGGCCVETRGLATACVRRGSKKKSWLAPLGFVRILVPEWIVRAASPAVLSIRTPRSHGNWISSSAATRSNSTFSYVIKNTIFNVNIQKVPSEEKKKWTDSQRHQVGIFSSAEGGIKEKDGWKLLFYSLKFRPTGGILHLRHFLVLRCWVSRTCQEADRKTFLRGFILSIHHSSASHLTRRYFVKTARYQQIRVTLTPEEDLPLPLRVG